MSFGGGGGFAFGGSNQNTGFGGFGANTNTTTPSSGFGANTTNTGFGASTAAANPFGGSTFGSNTGGFGGTANTSGSSLFGNKPATNANPFGASTANTGGGLFGGASNATGFGASPGGGFGANTGAGGAFGSPSAGGTNFSFGNTNKPAFGSSTTNTTPLFGQGGAGTTGGFGAPNAFGAAGAGTALSTQPVPPSDGTASTPFAPTVDKDAVGPGSNYQSINFMPPYQKYSFEELRLADYNAGRRYGNATGQAGGFGSSTFGGFGGASSTPGFGAATSGPSAFGANATTASGFGANTATAGFGGGGGGSLFGNKPAQGGLFGQQSSSTASGGLFGTANAATGGGFGSSNTGFNAGGGGLFGGAANQNKPSPFGGNTGGNSFGFGGNANTSNANTASGLFGTTASNANAFGGNQQQQQQPQSGGLFGNSQPQKSLFGNTTGGFGGAATANQPSTGLFGNANAANPSGGGLFGGANANAATPNTGGGLFGASNTNTGGSLFGNAANNAAKPGGLFSSGTFGAAGAGNTGGGLFSNANANPANPAQPSGGLFGSAPAAASTGSGFSFGGAANKPAATSLFGTGAANQAAGGGGFGSLFANSQQNAQAAQQAPDFKHSSLNDANPYGQTSIWTGLPVPTPENSQPLFTPLSATQKLKESQAKPPPSLRLNQSRYMTPPRRSGFGFSYSTYGTPNSAASTPGGAGLTGSMYGSRSFTGGSFGRAFGKSASASNLRSQFNGDESVLSPNAFAASAASTARWAGGNMRRLTIDRSIRNDLFSRPSLPALPTNALDKAGAGTPAAPEPATEPVNKLKKRVSFDKDTTGGPGVPLDGQTGAMVRVETDSDDAAVVDDADATVNGSVTPDHEPGSRGNELAAVPEDRESDHVSPKKTTVQARPDPQPGDYWMSPTRAELAKLPRDRLQRYTGFEVGRKGCGRVVFNSPVDLTAINMDDLYEKLVEIRLRSVTVYPNASTKPPVGKGLNVPSTISIENSWPRARGQPSSATTGPIFEKHINRLKKMAGTEFVNYEVTTGVWTFRVPHYTRYGLDYDEDEDDDLTRSQLSAGPASSVDLDPPDDDDDEMNDDDTFAFKQKTVPGEFGRAALDYDSDPSNPESGGDLNWSDRDGSDTSDLEASDDEVSMAGSFPGPGAPPPDLLGPRQPILKTSRFGTPGRPLVALDGDWAEQLQRTISPRKQNRDMLRDAQSKLILDRAYEPIRPQPHPAPTKTDFRTSIDIMNSLFDRHDERMGRAQRLRQTPCASAELEFPFAKRAKSFDETDAPVDERSRPTTARAYFTTTNQLVFHGAATSVPRSDGDWRTEGLVADNSGRYTVCVSSLQKAAVDITAMDYQSLSAGTRVVSADGVPFISHTPLPFSQTRDQLIAHRAGTDEIDLYELAHVLFDDYDDEFTAGLNRAQKAEFQGRIRKDRLSKYVASLVWRRHGERIQAAGTSRDAGAAVAAVLYLTAQDVGGACDALVGDKNVHLTMLVAQIAHTDGSFQDDMANQMAAWREQGVISEMSEPIRALYELLAGNSTVCHGRQNVPVEDRATTFTISDRFELDWLQAFGLCLWYGRQKNGDIRHAVEDFAAKLSRHEEPASPFADDGKQDPLWLLLQLYATTGAAAAGRRDGPILPQDLCSLSQPWDSHKTFRLHHHLAAAVAGVTVDQDKADELAASLAFEYSARSDVVGAAFALLHLHDSSRRAAEVQGLLMRHAAILPRAPDADTDPATVTAPVTWTALTTSLAIPPAWIYRALAVFARASNDFVAEIDHLILADDLGDAHESLLRRVAPRLVINEDWDTLRGVLAKFGDQPAARVDGAGHPGRSWNVGGAVYTDFVDLLALPAAGDRARRTTLLRRLQSALTGLNARLSDATPLDQDQAHLEERVALREMGRTVAAWWEPEAADGIRNQKSILDLPLTSDAKLTHSRALGLEYYRGLMAMAR